jgi:uncharacterized protein YjbI with pentapeptide repeats
MAELIVFLPRLISFGATLFSVVMVISVPAVDPSALIPGTPSPQVPAGCLMVGLAIFLLPLSLLPAVAAWVIQKRVVHPREAAKRIWCEAAEGRENRFWAWVEYLIELLLRHRSLPDNGSDHVTHILRAELPRALHELDQERQGRLLLFLREVGLESAENAPAHAASDGISNGEPVLDIPRRSRVFLVAGILALLSGFVLSWTVLSTVSALSFNPFDALGIPLRPVEIAFSLSGCWITALVLGLAPIGLLRVYRRMVRSRQQYEENQAGVQDLIMKSSLEQIRFLARWGEGEGRGSEIICRRISRALILITTPRLDGSRRGRLVRHLYEAGWLTGQSKFSVREVDLQGVELSTATLSGICLAGADLSGADLSYADLGAADLRACTFRGADLRFARLVSADLRGADLCNSLFQRAELEGADLQEAFLDGANFWSANLTNAVLTGSRGTAKFLVTETV